jgi:hypothetical protein
VEQFEQNQRVIADFAADTLARIGSDFGRLLHVASLREDVSQQYRDEALLPRYSAASVHQALEYCHQELFARILAAPLERQHADLCQCLAAIGPEHDAGRVAALWLDSGYYRELIPAAAPLYLQELFCSNLRLLLGLITRESSSAASGAWPPRPPGR